MAISEPGQRDSWLVAADATVQPLVFMDAKMQIQVDVSFKSYHDQGATDCYLPPVQNITCLHEAPRTPKEGSPVIDLDPPQKTQPGMIKQMFGMLKQTCANQDEIMKKANNTIEQAQCIYNAIACVNTKVSALEEKAYKQYWDLEQHEQAIQILQSHDENNVDAIENLQAQNEVLTEEFVEMKETRQICLFLFVYVTRCKRKHIFFKISCSVLVRGEDASDGIPACTIWWSDTLP